MTPSDESSLQQDGYVLDAESATEMARLMLQDRMLNKMVGGLLPELETLQGIHRILDIGCGPGGWALDVARTYPEVEVLGIDNSKMMISYAQGQTNLHRLPNGFPHVTFQLMDARRPLQFQDSFFDLVNIRAAFGYLHQEEWPVLLRECARVTRKGGILRLTETDRVGLTTSPAFEKYFRWCARFLKEQHYGFSPDGFTFGMTPVLSQLLRQAGYDHVQMKVYTLDFSYGTPLHEIQTQNIVVGFKLMQRNVLSLANVTLEEIENTYEQMVRELNEKSFCGILYLFTVWGEK